MAELNAEQVPQKNEAVPGPLRVNGAGHSRLVQELALNAGDIIVAVNGILWSRVRSLEYAIDTLVEKAEKPVILTILRAGQFFDVITDSPVKNQTKVVMQEEVESLLSGLSIPLAPDSKNVSRYAVFTSMDHQADIVELRPSFSAMLFPPLWLVFRGLWAGGARRRVSLPLPLPLHLCPPTSLTTRTRSVCLCVCVFVCVRARARVRVCVFVCVCVCV